MRSQDESELVARLRRGDGAAFEHLLREHGSWMLGLARRILGDDVEAEDAVQDACLSAFRALPAFDGQSRVTTWLHRIVVNAALMRLRSRRRRTEGRADASAATVAGVAAEWRSRASTSLEDAEVRAEIRRAVDGLPTPYRAVFVLRDVEGLEMEEVARLLDLTVSGAKSRLHRARQTLRESLSSLFGADRVGSRVRG